TLDFDPSLDAFVAGRGGTTLRVTGFPVTVDATGLSADHFFIDGGHDGSGPTSVATTLPLVPGLYGFGAPISNPFSFQVTPTGVVSFDPSLDGFVSGRGATTLRVAGFPLLVDGTALAAGQILIDGSHDGSGADTAPVPLRLVPGLYGLTAPGGISFT